MRSKNALIALGLSLMLDTAVAGQQVLEEGNPRIESGSNAPAGQIRQTVQVGSTTLSLLTGPAGRISAPGLEALTLVFDPAGRILEIRGDRRGRLVSYSYRNPGQVARVGLSDRFTLDFFREQSGRVRQVLGNPHGVVLRETTPAEENGLRRWSPVSLDLVAERLGLSPDWANEIQLSWDPSGSVLTVNRLGGSPLLYLLRSQAVTVAFEPTGRALFYDLDLTPHVGPGPASAMVPTRLLLTNEQVALQAPLAPDGGVRTLTLERDDSGTARLAYSYLHSRSPGSAIPQTVSPLEVTSWYRCGTVTTCESYDSGETWNCSSRPEWCWAPDWGGCYDYCSCYGGCGGGGGGGGGGNQDPRLTDPDIKELREDYERAGCSVPGATEFVDEASYVDPGHFSFAELRDDDPAYGSPWAILTPALLNGLEATRANYGNQPIYVNSAYRTPDNNASEAGSAQCSRHMYGLAADLWTGCDCATWNDLADAANRAGAWVEPIADSKCHHVHVDWGLAANDKSNYGECGKGGLR